MLGVCYRVWPRTVSKIAGTGDTEFRMTKINSGTDNLEKKTFFPCDITNSPIHTEAKLQLRNTSEKAAKI